MVLSIFSSHLKSIHLLGVGKVGCAFLNILDKNKYKVTAISDSKNMLQNMCGLNIAEILKLKEIEKKTLSFYRSEKDIYELNSSTSSYEICIDTTSTNLKNIAISFQRSQNILKDGKFLILSTNDALFYGIDQLITEFPGKIGINAALSGTGNELIQNINKLRNECFAISIVGNAASTALIQDIENGLSLNESIEKAKLNDLLENDSTFDLDGSDALTKISIVSKAVFGHKFQLEKLNRKHINSIDPELIRYRKKNGKTTRLVGKAGIDGSLKISYDEVDLNSPLCTTQNSVTYHYHLKKNSDLILTGNGIRPQETAKAILKDLDSFYST